MKVAIVGCGVMGAATGWALTKRGHDVSIYEQFEGTHKRGSSHGATRIYRYSYPDERYVGMMKEAMELWRALEAHTGERILHRTGGLDMGDDLDDHQEALTAHDIHHEVFDAAEAALRWPFFSLPAGPVLYQADGGVIFAEAAWHSFVMVALSSGARLLEERRIDEIPSEGFADYDVTVVTAGGWAPRLLMTAGVRLDAKPTRETVAFFPGDFEPPTLVDWGDPSVYALPDGRRGLKVAEHIAGPFTDPDRTGEVDQASVSRVSAWVAARYPDIDHRPMGAETCIYTNTPDGHFVLERHGNIVVGSACSGHGFKFAPLIGERLADLAEA